MNVLECIEKYRLIPVIKLENPDQAMPLAGALLRGGLPIAEVTFRTSAAEESIRIMRTNYPEVFVGAGSLKNLDQCILARDAGAQFFVSAGFSEKIACFADEYKIPYFPGVATATEIMLALEHDYRVVKFFPASNLGGMAMVKAISAPFPGLRFIPTGGVNADNVAEYLASEKIFAVGGSWMVPSKLLAEGKYDEIEALVQEAVSKVF